MSFLKSVKRVVSRAAPRRLMASADRWQAAARGRDRIRPLDESVRFSETATLPICFLFTTKTGVFEYDRGALRRLLRGNHYGLSYRDDRWYAFHRASHFRGRVISWRLENGQVADARMEIDRLSSEIHQIDWIDDSLWIADTENNRLCEYTYEGRRLVKKAMHYPAGKSSKRGSPGYVHLNSLWSSDENIHLVYHNLTKETGRKSEIAVIDAKGRVQSRFEIDAGCAHNAIETEYGMAYCDSLGAAVVVGDTRIELDAFTRGLALGDDWLIVGGSQFAAREQRQRSDSKIFACSLKDRSVIGTIDVWGAGGVYDLRLIDPVDKGLSGNARRSNVTPLEAV